MRRLALFSLSLLAASASASAQTSPQGLVTGTVTAPDSTPISAATITLLTSDSVPNIATSLPDGTFTLAHLPSGSYTLTASAPGFAPYRLGSVAVATGLTTHLSLLLKLISDQQSITVTAPPPTLDTTQTSSVVNIDRDRVEELPIPNRNFLNFILLSPQVAPANPALSQSSAAHATGSFSFGGLRPGSNAVYIDNVNDDDEFSGTSRTQLSPEAVNDFQIVNHGFSAESGGAAGGSIDVQTRIGLNHIHGDAFTFVQNGVLNAAPSTQFSPSRPTEQRTRAGLSVGGPLQQNKTFFFFAAEQEIAHGQEAGDLRPATLAAINAALAHTGPLASLTLTSGFFPTTDQETELSPRLDHNFSSTQSITLRYAFTNARSVADAFNTDELSDRTARGSTFTADNQFSGSLNSTFGANLLNTFAFQLAQRRAVERTGSTSGPGILIPGLALFGTPFTGNNRRFETHLEFADAVSLLRHHHLFHAGIRADRVALRASQPDGAQGLFVFRNLAALQSGNADFFTQTLGNQSFGSFNSSFTELRLATFLQDHWTPTPTLTLDLGLRYELNHLPQPLPQHPLNLSPRLGVAWNPIHPLVLRAGFGLFYDRFLLGTLNRILNVDGTHAYTKTFEDTAAANFYRTGLAPAAVASGIFTAAPTLANPYSEAASLSSELTLPLQSSLKLEYQYVHGVHLGRTANVNLSSPTVLTQANAASLGVSTPEPQQLDRPVFSPKNPDPRFDAINQFSTTAGSVHHSATVTLNRQFTDDFQLLAGYTFSKTIDDASSDTEQPQNPFAPREERSLSQQDQRHRLTLSGLFLIGPDNDKPADTQASANPGPLLRFFTGFEIAPIFSVTSGFRANPLTGLDSNREHIFPFAARPLGYARNSLSTKPNINFDLRLLRIIPLGRGHLDLVAESFNLLNHPNPSLLNTTYGPALQPQTNFTRANDISTPRRIQFSLDYEY